MSANQSSIPALAQQCQSLKPNTKTSLPFWTAALLLAERPGRRVHPQPAAVPACQPVQHRDQSQAVGGGGSGDRAAHHPVDGAVDLPGGVPPGDCNPVKWPGPGVSGQHHRPLCCMLFLVDCFAACSTDCLWHCCTEQIVTLKPHGV